MIIASLQDFWFSSKITLYLSNLAEQHDSLRSETVFSPNEARVTLGESHPWDINSKHN